MKKSEILKLLKYMNSYYGKRFEIPNNTEELAMKIETWYDFLGGLEYKVAQTAAKKLMNRSEWPPTPGEIVQEANLIMTPEDQKLTSGEAWQLVLEAIRKFGSTYGVQKAMDSLPERVKQTVECVGGLRVIGMSDETETYMMTRFKQVYDELKVRDREKEFLPGAVRKEVEQLANHFKGAPAIEAEIEGMKDHE